MPPKMDKFTDSGGGVGSSVGYPSIMESVTEAGSILNAHYLASVDSADISSSLEDDTFYESPLNDTISNHTIPQILGPHTVVTWQDLALVVLFCTVIAGTVIGNTLVIAAVATTRRLRTVTNCFVMSLAVADWLVGMFVMPFKVVMHLCDNVWHLGRIMCELWISLDILLCTASILSLCAISIDRYLAITRPLAYSRKRRSKRLALSMISCVWVAAVVITSPPILGWYDYDSKKEYECEYNDDRGYVIYSALGSFFIPLLVMLYVYAKIACVIAHRQKTIEKIQTNSEKKCCEDQDVNKEEAQAQIFEPGEVHQNRMERSSSTSGAHSINMTKLHVENGGSGFWSRFRTGSSFRKSHQNSIKSERSRKDGSGKKKGRPSTLSIVTLAAVVGGFIICWLPFFGAYVAGPFVPEGAISIELMDALTWLGWGNSAINPFIYVFYSPDFRSAFWRLTLHKVEWICRGRRTDRRYDDTGTIRAST